MFPGSLIFNHTQYCKRTVSKMLMRLLYDNVIFSEMRSWILETGSSYQTSERFIVRNILDRNNPYSKYVSNVSDY